MPVAGVVRVEEQWLQIAGQQWKAVLGEGSLMLPPLVFRILNSLFVPLSATVSFPVDSVPSCLPVARRHGVRRWSGTWWSSGPSWLAAGKVLSSLGPASGRAALPVGAPYWATLPETSVCSCIKDKCRVFRNL